MALCAVHPTRIRDAKPSPAPRFLGQTTAMLSSPSSSASSTLEQADILIIGGGQAGFQVAASLRQKRFDGSILLCGEEAHPPYQRPPLSKAALKGDLEETALWYRPDAFYNAQGIDVRGDLRALSIDRSAKTVRFDDGSAIAYGTLVLATGARARALPSGLAIARERQFMLRTLQDAQRLKPKIKQDLRLAIIGAGYIGLEVAASARQLGAEVTVIDLEDRVMKRTASAPVSAYFHQRHLSEGVVFHLGDGLLSAGAQTLSLTSGTSVDYDIVLAGIGVIPNAELAADAGLSVSDGILTDDQGRTNDPAIFAAGDCARHRHGAFVDPVRFESVQSATDQAKVVAAAILGEEATHQAVPWFWSDQYDVKLQVVGVPQPGDALSIRGDRSAGSFAIYHRNEEGCSSVEAINAPQDFVAARKSLGLGKPLDEAIVASLKPLDP